MSTRLGRIKGHQFHGDPKRFEALSEFIGQNYQGKVKRIADVAGGQGMLARILKKRYNFEVTVIDPRGYVLRGVENIAKEYDSQMADYYDLIVGLHPDQALVEIVKSALVRPVIVIPCCNFWSDEEVLGRDALLEEIKGFLEDAKIEYQEITFDFRGPKNIGLVTTI